MARAEFVLLWMTFLAIIYTDLERGIAAGVIFSVFYFAFSYAKVRGGDACKSGGATHPSRDQVSSCCHSVILFCSAVCCIHSPAPSALP